MLPGTRCRLERDTLALGLVEGRRKAVSIPPGALLEVLSPPSTDHMVDVRWNGQIVTMFAIDLSARGTVVFSATA
jgi:hypothetical protein